MIEKVLEEFTAKAPALNTVNIHIIHRSFNNIMAHNAMIACNGNATEASEMLGIQRSTLSKYLDKPVKQWREENGIV